MAFVVEGLNLYIRNLIQSHSSITIKHVFGTTILPVTNPSRFHICCYSTARLSCGDEISKHFAGEPKPFCVGVGVLEVDS